MSIVNTSISFTFSAPTTPPGTDQVKTYGLDGLGNWKTSNFTVVNSDSSTTDIAEVRQHNYVNEITSIRDTPPGTPTAFAYDKNGNLLNDGVRIYVYDAFNRLVQINRASDNTALVTYLYDVLGRRVKKTVANLGGGMGGLTGDIPAGSTTYIYDGPQVIEIRDTLGHAWSQFWGQYIDELLFIEVPGGTPTTYRVLSDLLYRSTAIVTTSNVVSEAYDTDAYGNTLCYSGPGTDGLWFTDDDVRTNNPINNIIFTGRQYDQESQIYYYRARYYSPRIGRFISRDPYVDKAGNGAEFSQGPNLYSYVGNAPILKTDPMGLETGVGWTTSADFAWPVLGVEVSKTISITNCGNICVSYQVTGLIGAGIGVGVSGGPTVSYGNNGLSGPMNTNGAGAGLAVPVGGIIGAGVGGNFDINNDNSGGTIGAGRGIVGSSIYIDIAMRKGYSCTGCASIFDWGSLAGPVAEYRAWQCMRRNISIDNIRKIGSN